MSKVIVRLPGAGKSFTAIVGVDSNEQTRPGKGSVVFSVSVGEQEASSRRRLMREGMPGVPVQVDLGDARSSSWKWATAATASRCDQADWADARVELADGTTRVAGRSADLRRQRTNVRRRAVLLLHL